MATQINAQRPRGTRGDSGSEPTKNEIKQEVNDRYREIRRHLYKILPILEPSASDEFSGLKEGVTYFSQTGIKVSSINKMLNDPEELERIKDVGTIYNRNDVENILLPALEEALRKEEGSDYSLNYIADKLNKIVERAQHIETAGTQSSEIQNEINEFYAVITAFYNFTDQHVSVKPIYEQAKEIQTKINGDLKEKYSAYSAGDFHQKVGKGIFLSQTDGIDPASLNDSHLTDEIIIDGKKPVHLFVLLEMPLLKYGGYLWLDIVDGGHDKYQNKYVFDPKKMIPLDQAYEKNAYIKLVLVPSASWNDLDKTYVKSQFYKGSIHQALAQNLIPNEPKKLTIYADNGKVVKNITVTAPEEGIAFLKSIKEKMKVYEIDAARMEKAAVHDASLENKIKSLFLSSNSEDNISIERVIISSKPWYVERDDWDRITHRHCYAQVAFKAADGLYYTQKIHCTQKYQSGNYQPLKINPRFETRQIRKENIHK